MRSRPSLLLLLAGALALPGRAGADQGIDAQLFKPALDPYGVFSVERAQGPARYDFALRMDLGYASAPLKLDVPNVKNGNQVLSSQTTYDLGFSLGISDRLSVGLAVSLQYQPLGPAYGTDAKYDAAHPEDVGTGFYSVRPDENVTPSTSSPGDPRLGIKYRFTGGRVGIAAQAIVHVPFGDEDVFAGSKSVTFEPKLIIDFPLGTRGFLAINAGARLRQGALARTARVDDAGTLIPAASADDSTDVPLLFVGSEAVLGVGARLNLLPRLSLGAEAYALIPVAGSSACTDTTIDTTTYSCKNGDLAGDALVGVVYQASAEVAVSLAGGTSILASAARADAFRGILSLFWSPTPAGALVRSHGDRDGDGIPDSLDQCPDEPEDHDGFQDDDGCPDPDNDSDGVPDIKDKCPMDPEDRDGFHDDDGCPDSDNDADGVPDLQDQCPGDPEDKDGYQDEDGCPDPDNDGDGIPDEKDNCPNEPGPAEGGGCPVQTVATGPQLSGDRIDLQGNRIDFVGATSKLAPGVEDLLVTVADVMKSNPDIRFRIEVGVERSSDARDARAKDMKLAAERGTVVLQFLLGKGVRPSQVDMAPLGSDYPLDAKNPKDPKTNRRVEFIRINQQ